MPTPFTRSIAARPPLRVFLWVLAVVFMAEAGVMAILPLLLSESTGKWSEALLDSTLLTMISAPIIWWVVIAPLRRAEREASRAESLDAMARLATGVAHEVRNPLTSIKLLVQSNIGTDVSDELKEDLRIIEAEIRRMESNLNTFLDFARPRPLQRSIIRLRDIIESVRGLVSGRLEQNGVSLLLDAPDEPVTVDADAEQLRQVLLNLTLNALEMMPKGGRIMIRLDRCDENHVCVHVSDTGPGIAEEHMPRLFEPFFTTRETGVGLGLVISKQIAERHGGNLGAKNRPGGGACFTLRIPTVVPS